MLLFVTASHYIIYILGIWITSTQAILSRKTDATTGSLKKKTNFQQFTNNLFRHFIIGVEIIPIKYFSVHFAYNYNTRQEMKAYARKGFVGFSYGLSLRIYNINVQYARVHNNLASTPNYFTFSTIISKFSKK